MKPMERLVGVVAAGFLLLFGIYLTYGYHFGPFGQISLVVGGAAVIAGLVVLVREVGLYIFHLLPPEDFTGSEPTKKEEDEEHGTTD